MDGNGELHHTQIGAQVPPGAGNLVDQEFSDFFSELFELGSGETGEGSRRVNPVELSNSLSLRGENWKSPELD